MDLLTTMAEYHVWLTGERVRLGDRLIDEQLDQRIELDVDDDRQTIRSLLSRLIAEPAEVFTYGGHDRPRADFAAHRRTLVVLALGSHGVNELGWGDPMRWVAQPA